MTQDLTTLLTDYALGILGTEERAHVEAKLLRSPELAQELAEIEASLATLALALPSVRPEPGRKEILLQAAADQRRFSQFVEPLAELFDVAKEQVVTLLGWLADPRRWQDGGIPGVEKIECTPGPKAAKWQVGFLRFAPGLAFPRHRHLGEDTLLVLSGEYRDSVTSVTHKSGDLIVLPPGSEHAFFVSEDEPCLVATRFPGIEVLG